MIIGPLGANPVHPVADRRESDFKGVIDLFKMKRDHLGRESPGRDSSSSGHPCRPADKAKNGARRWSRPLPSPDEERWKPI